MRAAELTPGTVHRVRWYLDVQAGPWGRRTHELPPGALITVLAAPLPPSEELTFEKVLVVGADNIVGWVTSIVLAQQDRVTP